MGSQGYLAGKLRVGALGEIHAASNDESISIIYRYALAVRDGAANRDLRLLAKSMVGLAQRDRLFSDEFNKYVEVLGRLSRDQIFVLGKCYSIHQIKAKETTDRYQASANSFDAPINSTIPSVFETEQHIEVILARCAALGLMLPNLAIGGHISVFTG